MGKFKCGSRGPDGKSRYRLGGDNAVMTPVDPPPPPLSISTIHPSTFRIQLLSHSKPHRFQSAGCTFSSHPQAFVLIWVADRVKHSDVWSRIRLNRVLMLAMNGSGCVVDRQPNSLRKIALQGCKPSLPLPFRPTPQNNVSSSVIAPTRHRSFRWTLAHPAQLCGTPSSSGRHSK